DATTGRYTATPTTLLLALDGNTGNLLPTWTVTIGTTNNGSDVGVFSAASQGRKKADIVADLATQINGVAGYVATAIGQTLVVGRAAGGNLFAKKGNAANV